MDAFQLPTSKAAFDSSCSFYPEAENQRGNAMHACQTTRGSRNAVQLCLRVSILKNTLWSFLLQAHIWHQLFFMSITRLAS